MRRRGAPYEAPLAAPAPPVASSQPTSKEGHRGHRPEPTPHPRHVSHHVGGPDRRRGLHPEPVPRGWFGPVPSAPGLGARQAEHPIARPYQLAAAAQGRPGVVLVGKAQERMEAWRGWVDKASPRSTKDHPHFSFSRQAAVPDHWYFYLWDEQWGPAFIKFTTYAPYGLWVSANGHEWAKRQLHRAGIAFTELENGMGTVEDPDAARRVCARL